MQEAKVQDKREDILDVAEKLFAEQGFEAISIREISKSADINIAMVSYYFGSKEKLYEEVVNRKLISSDLIIKHIEQYEAYQEKLFAIVDLFINKFFERRDFQNIIFREMAMNQRTGMAELITTRLHQNFSVISDVIQKGIKYKEFKKVDVELTVMTIIGVVKNLYDIKFYCLQGFKDR
jgi:AcrR family transcriptional regulator